jgi:SAM-dependent methyltransferase
VAAGTGALTLMAAERGIDVTAVDFAPGMVEFLRGRLPAASPKGRVREMDGQELEFADASFDAGCSLFGLILLPDTDRGLRELARVVRPGGRVLVGAWARGRFALHHALHAALTRTVPGYTPPAGPPAFMGLGSADDLSGAFRRAGLDDVTVTEVTHGCRIDDPERFFAESPSWSPPLQPALEAMTPPVRADAAGARGRRRCAQTPPLRSPGRWQRSAGTPAWSRRPYSPAPSAERRHYRTTARAARRSADPARVSRLRAGAGRCRRRRRPGPAP